jgi:hypothetical protein
LAFLYRQVISCFAHPYISSPFFLHFCYWFFFIPCAAWRGLLQDSERRLFWWSTTSSFGLELETLPCWTA